jgi:hypothetical protein
MPPQATESACPANQDGSQAKTEETKSSETGTDAVKNDAPSTTESASDDAASDESDLDDWMIDESADEPAANESASEAVKDDAADDEMAADDESDEDEVAADDEAASEEVAADESSTEEVAADDAEDESALDEVAADEPAAEVERPCYPSENDSAESWKMYGYQYASPEAQYGRPESGTESTGTEESAEAIQYSTDGEPAEMPEEAAAQVKANETEQTTESAPATLERESGLELFNRAPADLLTLDDRQLLRALENLSDEPSDVRRSLLSGHFGGLGLDAVAFAERFHETTGMSVNDLADDLPGAAALLASFRLIERGELGMEESVDVLRRTLNNLSCDWVEGVRAIASSPMEDGEEQAVATEEAPAPTTTSNGSTVSDVLRTIFFDSLESLEEVIVTTSQQFTNADWSTLLKASEGQAANQGGADRF